MDAACEFGQLHVVKWLHSQHQDCTSAAFDLAAANNHLAVTEWLLENRSEGCTCDAIELAAIHGHKRMVTWLCDHFPSQLVKDSKALELAAEHGQTAIVDFLTTFLNDSCGNESQQHSDSDGWEKYSTCSTASSNNSSKSVTCLSSSSSGSTSVDANHHCYDYTDYSCRRLQSQCVSVVHSTDSNSYRNSSYTCQQRRATISDVTDTDVTEHNSDDDDSAETIPHKAANMQQQQQQKTQLTQQQQHAKHSNNSSHSGTIIEDRAMLSPTH
eukprot:19259-Heterococcus_DN1.PRE.1